ncbi:MAG: outer membrane protein assembly factor BamD [Candidatus Marinimicrobia bacterium]|nr:outer membrane protein assembly factor BamD [Candidatus Neomarinimicrobiota bacterium]
MKDRMNILKGTAILLISIIFIGCNSATRQQIQDVEFRFDRGKQLFQDGKYYKAIDDFNYVVLNNPGGVNADDAQLFIADSHFEVREFVVAASEYQRLMTRYPESPLVEQAQYKLGMCFVELSPHYQLQQDYTQKAINTLQNFIEDFPNSTYKNQITEQIDNLRAKLAHKMYSNGHLYFVLRQYDSAIIYYDQILSGFYDTEWANISRLERGKSLMKMDRIDEARVQLQDLVNRDAEQALKSEARRLLQELETEENATQESLSQAETLEE